MDVLVLGSSWRNLTFLKLITDDGYEQLTLETPDLIEIT